MTQTHKRIPVVIQGAKSAIDLPAISSLEDQAELRFVTDRASLANALPGAEVLLGWNFRANDLEQCWAQATDLKWIHWGGAGVERAMFPALVASPISLTNSRGVFDRAMAEWALGMMIAHAKDMARSLEYQRHNEWNYRLNRLMLGQTLLVVGVGSIGREIARLCRAFGLTIKGVGRSARQNDPDFGHIHGQAELNTVLGDADYVVLITPMTPENENLFSQAQFTAMKPDAQFINIGRGALVNEDDLLNALNEGHIGSAALDVFRDEPLPADNAIWDAPNMIVSPHSSGDYQGHEQAVIDVFLDNFKRYLSGQNLINMVDKQKGYVPNTAS